MATATISSKGWIVIPAELRQKHALHPGKQVTLVDYGGVLAIVPLLSNPVAQAEGMLKGGSSLVNALLRDRAEEIANGR